MINLSSTANGMGVGSSKQRGSSGAAAVNKKQNLKRPAPVQASQSAYTPLPMTNTPNAPAKKKVKIGGRDKPNMIEEMEFFEKVTSSMGLR